MFWMPMTRLKRTENPSGFTMIFPMIFPYLVGFQSYFIQVTILAMGIHHILTLGNH